MNILYRERHQLAVNIEKIEDRLLFYQDNIYDNVYFLDNHGGYLYYLNWQIEKDHNECNNKCYMELNVSYTSVKEWFMTHRNIYRVPVLENGILIGEYYDSDYTGRSLYKKIEDRALEIIPLFHKEITNWIEKLNVSYLEYNGLLPLKREYSIQSNIHSDAPDYSVDQYFTNDMRKILMPDTYSNHHTESDILIKFLIEKLCSFSKQRNINLYAVNGIKRKELENLSHKEQDNLGKNIEEVCQDYRYLCEVFKDDERSLQHVYDNRYEIGSLSKVINNGIHNILVDVYSEDFNVVNGMRLTVGTPEKASQNVHIFGPCIVHGLCVTDDKTIASLLQKTIKENGYKNVSVHNHGLAYGKDLLNDILAMVSTPLYDGDIIIWICGWNKDELQILRDNNFCIIDGKTMFKDIHNWFLDNPFHCNSKANDLLSQEIYKSIYNKLTTSHKITSSSTSCREYYSFPLRYNPDEMINSKELDSYINYISHYKVDKNIVGAIVMNANPFTNGHRYLIEKALEEVEYLYVFVVESNRCSSYDYMEREWMVRKSTEDLKNVCILSGGSIFTSELSFPEYFNRSASKTEINPTLNNKIFGMKIAPALNITHRYFGEETIDNVTKALNEAASSELPNYGIQVHIVERLKIGQEPISAKNVRKYINYGNKEELRKLVPNCVLEKIIIS